MIAAKRCKTDDLQRVIDLAKEIIYSMKNLGKLLNGFADCAWWGSCCNATDKRSSQPLMELLVGRRAKRGITSISFESTFQKGLVFTTRALILKVVMKCALPAMSENSLAELDNLELADPDYYKGGKIDII